MEIRVPVFAGRRILKKESLWDIRDVNRVRYGKSDLCYGGRNGGENAASGGG